MSTNTQKLTYYQKIEMLYYKDQKTIMKIIKRKEKNIEEINIIICQMKKKKK